MIPGTKVCPGVTPHCLRVMPRDAAACPSCGYTWRVVSTANFGKDHWSTFVYIETRCVDDGGFPEHARMRTDPHVHPHLGDRLALADRRRYPTRLADGTELTGHDDWSCLDDCEAAGLLRVAGTGLHPRYVLTDTGRAVAGLLRQHKAEGKSFATFRWSSTDGSHP